MNTVTIVNERTKINLSDIDASRPYVERNFHDAFGGVWSLERGAYVLVWFLQDRGRATLLPFTRSELVAFCAVQEQALNLDVEHFNSLVMAGYIIEQTDGFHLTEEFLQQCAKVAPAWR